MVGRPVWGTRAEKASRESGCPPPKKNPRQAREEIAPAGKSTFAKAGYGSMIE
jgi:hypothetical protein